MRLDLWLRENYPCMFGLPGLADTVEATRAVAAPETLCSPEIPCIAEAVELPVTDIETSRPITPSIDEVHFVEDYPKGREAYVMVRVLYGGEFLGLFEIRAPWFSRTDVGFTLSSAAISSI